MLSEQAATTAIKKAYPDSKISSPISYKGLYIFQVYGTDPDESIWDPFRSVNQQTGVVNEFSIITDGDPNVINDLFVKKQQEARND